MLLVLLGDKIYASKQRLIDSRASAIPQDAMTYHDYLTTYYYPCLENFISCAQVGIK
jgi:hypothetical protein